MERSLVPSGYFLWGRITVGGTATPIFSASV